jgi:hypothetical protein
MVKTSSYGILTRPQKSSAFPTGKGDVSTVVGVSRCTHPHFESSDQRDDPLIGTADEYELFVVTHLSFRIFLAWAMAVATRYKHTAAAVPSPCRR